MSGFAFAFADDAAAAAMGWLAALKSVRRLSPHTLDMVKIAGIFRDALDGRIAADEARQAMRALDAPGPFANGFFHGRAGHRYIEAAASARSH